MDSDVLIIGRAAPPQTSWGEARRIAANIPAGAFVQTIVVTRGATRYFPTELAGVLEHDLAVVFVIFVQRYARMRAAH